MKLQCERIYTMSDDNIYQNDGESFQNGIYYPEAPDERREDESKELAGVSASLPIMPEIAAWFDAAVAECDNMDNIQIDEIEANGVRYHRNVSIEAQVLAYQLLKAKLTEKKLEFQDFMEPKQ